MDIDYVHSLNSHTLESPKIVMPLLFGDCLPASLLDVGCGTGTWLKAAAEMGISDFLGVDGVNISPDQLLFPSMCFRLQDLTEPWDLGRRFDAVLCMEVAEHLDEAHAGTLIDALVRHSDLIVFSAACPGQGGQHHINCQWPTYWQQLFNQRGYSCEDAVRWKIWNVQTVEPWYRQNIFIARRLLHKMEQEAMILPVLHPEIVDSMRAELTHNLEIIRIEYGKKLLAEYHDQILHGQMSLGWHLTLPIRAAWSKVRRKFKQAYGRPSASKL